jgi:hypothetical protein
VKRGKEVPGRIYFVPFKLTSEKREEAKMKGYISKRFFLLISFGLAIALVLTIFGLTGAQMPSLPKLPGGIKMPSAPPGKASFAGLDGLASAKEAYGQKDKAGYPTPNIAVSGNHVVIAWPNGVVTIETIADDGTITRTVLGPPSDKNIF